MITVIMCQCKMAWRQGGGAPDERSFFSNTY